MLVVVVVIGQVPIIWVRTMAIRWTLMFRRRFLTHIEPIKIISELNRGWRIWDANELIKRAGYTKAMTGTKAKMMRIGILSRRDSQNGGKVKEREKTKRARELTRRRGGGGGGGGRRNEGEDNERTMREREGRKGMGKNGEGAAKKNQRTIKIRKEKRKDGMPNREKDDEIGARLL